MGAVALAAVIVLILAIVCYLVGAIFWSRSKESKKKGHKLPMRDSALSLTFAGLFVLSWIGHGITEWQEFTDHARELGRPAEVGDFASVFAAATLENWQSEFLQLFSFVVLAAVMIHRGSAESKDSEERIESAIHRIEKHLGLTPVTEDPLSYDTESA